MILPLDFDQRKVQLFIGSLKFPFEFPAVGKFDLYLIGTGHNMVIGKNITLHR